MTIAVDLGRKATKQTNKQYSIYGSSKGTGESASQNLRCWLMQLVPKSCALDHICYTTGCFTTEIGITRICHGSLQRINFCFHCMVSIIMLLIMGMTILMVNRIYYCNSILSVLIWVLTVCKGYQQTTKIAASKE